MPRKLRQTPTATFPLQSLMRAVHWLIRHNMDEGDVLACITITTAANQLAMEILANMVERKERGKFVAAHELGHISNLHNILTNRNEG